jgi:site-specific recombinase XerD
VRTYWDTSAAINAAISPEVFRRLQSGDHVVRLHLLAEFFATMTGRGVEITDEEGNTDRMVFTQNECAAWLRKFAEKLQFAELTKEEALNGLDKAQSLSVQGARVYDYWHALVSAKAKSDELITRNTRHFEGLAENVLWP